MHSISDFGDTVRSDSVLNIKFDRNTCLNEKWNSNHFYPFVIVGSFFIALAEKEKGKEIGAKIYEDFCSVGCCFFFLLFVFGFSGFCLLYSTETYHVCDVVERKKKSEREIVR